MSRFLVLCEAGHRTPIVKPAIPLVVTPISVHLWGPSSAAREGQLVTDGHSSERFQLVGASRAARAGEELRQALSVYLRGRAGAGATIFLSFVWFDAVPANAVLNAATSRDVPLSEIESELPLLKDGVTLRVS